MKFLKGRTLKDKTLDLLLALFAVLFLLVGVTALGDDASGILLGFGTAIPLAAVFFWRKRREARGQSVNLGVLTLLLFLMTMLFWVVCLTALAEGGEDLAIGLVPWLILGAAYVLRRRRELRAADTVLEPVSVRPSPAPEKAASPAPSPRPAAVPVTVCPHCGAPGKGDICEYCGMSKKA